MKTKTFYILLLALLVVIPLSAENRTQIIAHRGFWKTSGSAQNSIRALDLANDINVYGSEFDVHITADNIPVVFHDDKFLGIPIQTSNYEDIVSYSLPNKEKIPTLEAYLNKGKLLKTKLIFELKTHATPERNREAARICVKMVQDMGLQERTEYITFNLDAGTEIIRLAPDAQVSYLNGDLSPAQLKEAGFTGLDYHFDVMRKNPDWFSEAKKLGLTINVWTVNTPDLIREMADKGADFITTDVPLEAQSIVSQPDK
ncbi:glycerophosphoryl diester phosphodiesterase [Parabacteroides sp. PF5-5]|uniref:glycerophosphodiester phosphodiesterase n=1 Tax=unclassified Parabacteroides TaxID=2649774 RepID=UPI002476E5B0|nr:MULTISPECIES: glycerophosphodiester phosphodiesterase family protein [unclassified Parabacteroides]MDH6304137.1 glycerophosphoryl diester phosphodiesterase [Parabacteroides sp. PH5-39]MDH6315163.1 glycerophosphoryl diester phosphodiesterase [Parabacteroides sp. PF5-13]MDH6318808.1 glycerophosphoryl diester phosphodiesterase [Parabacteroides sp. PH5-13]MDH6322537.1 glycerophosphoryl diester phosphodiesterase [Parabacteroides sp. PH5-8]MDH6326311.1 glycerophosphoryl diester phosphodiesterase 